MRVRGAGRQIWSRGALTLAAGNPNRPVYPVDVSRRNEEWRVVIEATVMANGHVGVWLMGSLQTAEKLYESPISILSFCNSFTKSLSILNNCNNIFPQ